MATFNRLMTGYAKLILIPKMLEEGCSGKNWLDQIIIIPQANPSKL